MFSSGLPSLCNPNWTDNAKCLPFASWLFTCTVVHVIYNSLCLWKSYHISCTNSTFFATKAWSTVIFAGLSLTGLEVLKISLFHFQTESSKDKAKLNLEWQCFVNFSVAHHNFLWYIRSEVESFNKRQIKLNVEDRVTWQMILQDA